MKIVANMIVKNEEVMIADCLASIKGVDQIIICDTGSEDRTVDIAKEHGAIVFTDYKWNDDFSEARNYALSKVPEDTDWILIIDADEVLKTTVDQVRMLASGKSMDKFDAIRFDVKTGLTTNDQNRLIRYKPSLTWVSSAHNQLYNIKDPEKLQADYQKLMVSPDFPENVIDGYLEQITSFRSSFQIEARTSPAHDLDQDRTLRILSKAVMKYPMNKRYMYYIAKEYLRRKDVYAALYFLQKYANNAPKFTNEMADVHYLLATCYLSFGDMFKVLDHCFEALKILPSFRAVWVLMVNISPEQYKPVFEGAMKRADNKGVLFIYDQVEKMSKQSFRK